jgi:non-canonical purine NTP pyrophosphatase (RdgB/HAM1 family)
MTTQDLIFVTSNADKIKYLELWLGHPIEHQSIDLPEIQSLSLEDVVTEKVQAAYEHLHQPVLVEDVALSFTALGKLPGTFIKWFLQELNTEGLCTLLDGYSDRAASAEIMYGLYDGSDIHYFSGLVSGTIASKPCGSFGFGWNSIFIPDGQNKTYAELSDSELKPYSHRARAIKKLIQFLDD